MPTATQPAGYRRFLPDERAKEDQRSDFTKAQERSSTPINCCKVDGFGCEDEELDAQGFCRHLVGFTFPGDPRHFQPLRFRTDAGGEHKDFRFVDGRQVCFVEKTDVLVPISQSSRVYRDVDRYGDVPQMTADELAEAAARENPMARRARAGKTTTQEPEGETA